MLPWLPPWLNDCPECLKAGHRAELVRARLVASCERCRRRWRSPVPLQLCDACGTRPFAVKWRGMFWCVPCLLRRE